jgi:uncharacterized damage-inducible protein DinB
MMSAQKEFRDNMARLLLRDLEAMRREIEHYPDDDSPWKAVPGLTNSGGTLVLHLAGNLQHFIGAVLGQTGYVRHRDMEFVQRGVTRAELVKELNATIAVVTDTLGQLDPSQLEGLFPQELAGVHVPTDMWLAHLATHLAYHLGQLDYHRRCVTANATTVGAMSIPALLLPFPPIPS